jgi:multicomponent Na+:H+ antiporter subunit F
MLLDAGFVALAFALLVTIWRGAVGPTDADRAVGADVAFFVFVAGVALLAIRLPEPVFIDVVLVGTLVGFVASVALAHLVDRRTDRGMERRADPPDVGGAR